MTTMQNENLVTKPSIVRSSAIDYLRALMTVFVLILHDILAYTTWGKFDPADYAEHSAAPIIDPNKWGIRHSCTAVKSFFHGIDVFHLGTLCLEKPCKKRIGTFS